MLDYVPEMLEGLEKEDVMEMRRRGRVFLARIDDAQGNFYILSLPFNDGRFTSLLITLRLITISALSKSLVAALSERIQIDLPLRPPV